LSHYSNTLNIAITISMEMLLCVSLCPTTNKKVKVKYLISKRTHHLDVGGPPGSPHDLKVVS